MAFIVPFIPYIIAGATAAVGYSSSMQAKKSSKELGELNAQLDEKQAQIALDQSRSEADRVRERNRRIRSTQRTSFLKSGLTLEGTPDDVMYDSSIQGELDALNVLYKGQVAAGYQRKSAVIARMDGNSRATAYQSQAYGSLLSGAGSALSAYNSPSFKAPTGGQPS
jgi:hypothetical protein